MTERCKRDRVLGRDQTPHAHRAPSGAQVFLSNVVSDDKRLSVPKLGLIDLSWVKPEHWFKRS